MANSKRATFIDLFAGLGGFHKGLSDLGMKCVFASEIDEKLGVIYEKNFGIKPKGDIRLVSEEQIPKHDVLCAGFPCQPFSIAGKRNGVKCPESGKLINDVIRIAKYHRPKYILLENVLDIISIDNGNFWQYIKSSFNNIEYNFSYKIYSPIDFNIPQNRKRIFIVAQHKSIKNDFQWTEITNSEEKFDVIKFLNSINNEEVKFLESEKKNVINLWQKIINNIPAHNINSNTIIATEFGATYPIDGFYNLKEIKKFKGIFGKNLSKCKSLKEVMSHLPHYIGLNNKPSKWLVKSIKYTRFIYKENINIIDKYRELFKNYPQSWQKLDWQGYKEENKINIWEHLIQFRASGIRVIKPEKIPSLIAMTPTQIPILGIEQRYITKKEASALQGLEDLKYLPENHSYAFKALGNAVNSKIIKEIAKNLLV